jgi:hypothetical protein
VGEKGRVRGGKKGKGKEEMGKDGEKGPRIKGRKKGQGLRVVKRGKS